VAQTVGRSLGAGDLVTISITAVLASMGAAGIPEAGLVMIVIVLTSVGLPLDLIGLFFSS